MNNIENTENIENNKTIRLTVITPMRVAYDKQVSMFVARTVDGDMGVLYGHEPRSAVLTDWAVRIFSSADDRDGETLMVLGGILTVRDNTATIVSDIAEYPDKMRELIDKNRAEREESRIKDQNTDIATQRMELAIRHALVQGEGSAYPIIKKNGPHDE